VIETPYERRRYRLCGASLLLEGRSIWQFLARSPYSARGVPTQYSFEKYGELLFSAKIGAVPRVFQSRHALEPCLKANSLLRAVEA
jgi:hypothetical protein